MRQRFQRTSCGGLPGHVTPGNFFALHHHAALCGFNHIEKEKQMLNEKHECIAAIVKGCSYTSAWRKALIARWPDDPRNARAAVALDKLAEDAESLTDGQWSELQPYYSWASEAWRNGLNQTTRQAGFHFRGELSVFVKALLENLKLSSRVAA